MKKNNLYNYITKNQKKIYCDVILYEYENEEKKYIISRADSLGGWNTYKTENGKTEQVKDNEELQRVWINTKILCEYKQGGAIFLQV